MSEHLHSPENQTVVAHEQTTSENELDFSPTSAGLEATAAAPITPANPTLVTRAFYNGKMAGAQRQALVQRMAGKHGNQYIQRIINHSCNANCGHLSSTSAKSSVARAPEAPAAQEEPLQLSGTIKPTQVDGPPESFCDSTSGKLALPGVQRWIPEMPAILRSVNRRNSGPLRMQLNLSMNQRTEQTPSLPANAHHAHAHDSASVNSTFSVKPKTLNSGSVAATGEEIFGYAAARVAIEGTWTLSDNILTVNAMMHVIAYWAISGQGRTPISGPDDDKINSESWIGILNDLKTDGEGVPMGRKLYYVPSFTTAHELFHVQDIFKQAATFVPTAKTWLDAQTVWIPDSSIFESDEDRKAKIQFNLNTPLLELSNKAEDNIKEYIRNGGETRAYRAGKSSYDGLRDAIKQKAKDNGWQIPQSPEVRDLLGLKPGEKKL